MTSKIIDTLLLGLVAAVGIVGSICVFSNDLGSPKHDLSIVSKQALPTSLATFQESAIIVDHLQINQKEHDRKVSFNIPNFNPRAEYQFDAGDGHKQVIEDARFKYQYPKAGAYQIKLTMTYHTQKKLVACKNITIF